MSQQFTGLVVADLAPAIEAINTAAKSVAAKRAQTVMQTTGGAIDPTSEQLGAIEAKAADEMFAALAEQLRDVTRTFIISINKG